MVGKIAYAVDEVIQFRDCLPAWNTTRKEDGCRPGDGKLAPVPDPPELSRRAGYQAGTPPAARPPERSFTEDSLLPSTLTQDP